MTLLIKQGRHYVRRDGKIAGPMEPVDYPWHDTGRDMIYTFDGHYFNSRNPTELDLLTELEEPSSPESVEGWSVPEGWKLVPIEPTLEMAHQGYYNHEPEKGDDKIDICAHIYRAMIAAAPLPPPSKDKGSAI
jgi:hypothetical protein